jgi:hypothetical protein
MNHVYGEEVQLGDNFTLCVSMYIYSKLCISSGTDMLACIYYHLTAHWLVIIHFYLSYIYIYIYIYILLFQHPNGLFVTFVRIY